MILVRDLYLLVRDDQDSVRICANNSCVALASVLSEPDRVTLILPLRNRGDLQPVLERHH